MAEQQFTDEHEASGADIAEQSLPVDGDGGETEALLAGSEVPLEVDPADAAEQAAAVPVDEDEYR
jgi:hypothetical protein